MNALKFKIGDLVQIRPPPDMDELSGIYLILRHEEGICNSGEIVPYYATHNLKTNGRWNVLPEVLDTHGELLSSCNV